MGLGYKNGGNISMDESDDRKMSRPNFMGLRMPLRVIVSSEIQTNNLDSDANILGEKTILFKIKLE